MKRINIILVMLIIVSGVFTIQSCKKDDNPKVTLQSAPVPEAPIPANGGVVLTGLAEYKLQWTGTSSTTVTKWNVYLSMDEAKLGSDATLVAGDLAANELVVTSKITKGGTYYWQIVNSDGVVETASAVWHFQVNSAPTNIVVISPLNAAVGVKTSAKLIWHKAVDAEKDVCTYDIYFGTDAAPALVVKGATDTTYTPAGLLYTQAYNWKVVAKDPYGGVFTSPLYTFTTGAYVPDYSVFKGYFSEVSSSFGTTKRDVSFLVDVFAHTIIMDLPLAQGMVDAGFGTVYTGKHLITIVYDPTTKVVSSALQPFVDSFIDPTEMGPMSIKVESGTIDPQNKKLSIKWRVAGNAYWGTDWVQTSFTTYTFRSAK